MSKSSLLNPLTTILQSENGAGGEDLPVAIVSESDLPGLPRDPGIPETRDALVQVRANTERIPSEVWRDAGFTVSEGAELVRAETRELLERRTNISWRTAERLIDSYLLDPDAVGADLSNALSEIRTAAELAEEPVPEKSYVVEGALAAGRVSILAAPPKGGKSTIARLLATAVSEGEDWCGLSTTQGRVLYLALEEHPDDVKADLQLFGAENENLDLYVARAPSNLGRFLQRASEERGGYSLVVVDTIFRGVEAEDSNDYLDTSEALEDVIEFAHSSGTHVLCIHHTRKGTRFAGGDPFEGILGSTGIWATFDAGMIYLPFSWGGDSERILNIKGRRHVEAGTRVIRQDENGQLHLVGSYRDARADTLYGYLSEYGPERDGEIADGLGSDWSKSTVRNYLSYLDELGRAERIGEGVKGDPYRWKAVEAETTFDADAAPADLSDVPDEAEGGDGE